MTKGKKKKTDNSIIESHRHLNGEKLHWVELKNANKLKEDHCSFCWGAFTEGFSTEDRLYLVCSKCFKEYRGELNWTIKT